MLTTGQITYEDTYEDLDLGSLSWIQTYKKNHLFPKNR